MLQKVGFQDFDNALSLGISQKLLSLFRKRKTTRFFQNADIDIEIIKNAIAVAGTAPSGANKQPWSFGLICDDEKKRVIRERAEEEEREFYEVKAPQYWLNDIKPFHTDSKKEFITEASYLIPVFCKQYDIDENNEKTTNYYVKESVGLATGFLISALHLSGLAVLTYTPSNRNFLVDLLGRPRNERTFMVLVVGRPATDAKVPVLDKKTLDEILTIYHSVEERASYC